MDLGVSGRVALISGGSKGIAAMAESYPGGVTGLANLTHKDVNLALSVAHEHELALPTTALSGRRLVGATAPLDQHAREFA